MDNVIAYPTERPALRNGLAGKAAVAVDVLERTVAEFQGMSLDDEAAYLVRDVKDAAARVAEAYSSLYRELIAINRQSGMFMTNSQRADLHKRIDDLFLRGEA